MSCVEMIEGRVTGAEEVDNIQDGFEYLLLSLIYIAAL